MESKNVPLTGQALDDWEASRDLGAELIASVDEIVQGGNLRSRVVEVSADVHNARMSVTQNKE